MRLPKVVLFIAFGVIFLVTPAAVRGDQVDFVAVGGNWSWDSLTDTVGGSATTVFAARQPSPGTLNPLPSASLVFATGTFTGAGDGTPSNPWDFGSGGYIDVIGSSGICASGCFLGSFTDVQIFNNTSTGLAFQGAFVGGTLSQDLLTLLGFPDGTPTNAIGFINAALSPNASGAGSTGSFNSANLVLTPTAVPEPSSLALLGLGLMGIALLTGRLTSNSLNLRPESRNF